MSMMVIVGGIIVLLFIGFPLFSFLKHLRKRRSSAGHPGLMDDYIKILAELEVKKMKKQDEEGAAAVSGTGKARAMTNRQTNSKSASGIAKVPAVNPSTGRAKTMAKKVPKPPAVKGSGIIKVRPSSGPHELKK
ncbi:MAG: hypothetical protein IH874_05735 [Candidatus Dadabacteria bacterium]|nr:hypothetical protein [Candidatus Dadabacteria bacterium]